MEYIIKDLVFKKKEDVSCNCYIANIKIYNILDIEIKIVERAKDHLYNVEFFSLNRFKCFTMCDDEPTNHYYKLGFKSYNKAYEYANKEMKSLLNNFISTTLADIYDYIEEIDEEDL